MSQAPSQAGPRAAPPLISPDLVSMIDRGVSVHLASRSLELRPSVMRGVGSRISTDGRTVTVYVSRRQAGQLLQDIAATGQVTAVFCEPASHCAVQLKARRASMRDASRDDEPLLARYLVSMEHEIQRVGPPPEVTRAMLAHRLEDLVAVTFEPEQAFDQTPGPKAGTRLAGGRA